MTDAVGDGGQPGVRMQGRRRARQPVPRARRVEVTLTGEEYAVIEAAARRAGLARRAYIAQAVLAAAANGGPLGDRESLRRVLIELMRAAGLVRRIGTNINQAVAKLNATGQPAGDLSSYAAGTIRRADHIDEIADAIRMALG
jgi:methyl-accepting chemotaxis protein